MGGFASSNGISRREMQELLGGMEDRLNSRLDGLGERLDRVEDRLDSMEARLGRVEIAVLGLQGDKEAVAAVQSLLGEQHH